MQKKKITIEKKRKSIEKLLLVDHDGTLCDTNPVAYDSIKYAFKTAMDVLKIPTPNNLDFEKVMADLRGSTEKNLVRYLSYFSAVPFDKTEQFEEKFYYFRAKWYENMRSGHEYVWDTYYPDSHQLVEDCKHSGKYELWVITGNPGIVLQERLSNSMKTIFSKNGKIQGVFGDQFYTRAESICEALKKAETEINNGITKKDSMGFYENVIYIGDSRNDFFAGIEAKVKTVWIPSRSLQVVTETRALDYVRFISEVLGDRILITNDLYSPEARKFVGLNY